MAAGDITYSNAGAGSFIASGGAIKLYGYVEHDATARSFALVNGTILGINLFDKEGANVSQCVINSDDATADSAPGYIYLQSNPDGEVTLKFEVTYIGM